MDEPSASRIVGGLRRRQSARPTPASAVRTVTVVVPCFNYARYVADAVRSALAQSGVEVEVIVVDDCSTDSSREVIEWLESQDSRVLGLFHEENRGPVETFNDGLARARGDFVVRLDADDLMTPGSLERAVAVAEAFPSVGLVYGHPLHFTDVPPRARGSASRWVIWPGHEWLADRCRTGVNVITSPEVVMRRSVIDRVGGQRPLAHTHDMEMWLRIAAVSDVAYIEGADQALHREHQGSLSRHISGEMGDLPDRREAFRTLFAWTAPFLTQTADLRQAAEMALAEEALRSIIHLHDRGRLRPETADALLRFANECETSGAVPPSLPAVARLLRRPMTHRSLIAVPRAAWRRIERYLHYRRWHRRGVYHR